jgi:ligand-binding sensor domain-containing protein
MPLINQQRFRWAFMRRGYAIGLCILVLLIFVTAESKERVQRHFDQGNGVLVSPVFSLAQDREGFIWLGTPAALLRFDGTEMRGWATNELSKAISRLLTASDGQIVALANDNILYDIIGDTVKPLSDSSGTVGNVNDATFDDQDRLWMIRDGSMRLTARDGSS